MVVIDGTFCPTRRSWNSGIRIPAQGAPPPWWAPGEHQDEQPLRIEGVEPMGLLAYLQLKAGPSGPGWAWDSGGRKAHCLVDPDAGGGALYFEAF